MNPRRQFLTRAAAITGISVAPGVFLYGTSQAYKPPEQPVTAKVRWGLLIDTNQCANGCDACVTACHQEHNIQGHGRPTTDPQWIRKIRLQHNQTGKVTTLPMMCQHCEFPPCVDVCPTGSSFRRADGIVLVDKHICIGCRYCMMACPYKARSFVHESLTDQKAYSPRGKGTVESCTLCVHRIDQGDIPACVTACHAAGQHAIIFGDLHNPTSTIAEKLSTVSSIAIRADMQLNPSIRYQGI